MSWLCAVPPRSKRLMSSNSAEIQFHSIASEGSCLSPLRKYRQASLLAEVCKEVVGLAECRSFAMVVRDRDEKIAVAENSRGFFVDLAITSEYGRLEMVGVSWFVVISCVFSA